MKHILTGFLNPVKWIRAIHYHKKQKPFQKAGHDLELSLYSKILRNDMLHWGYFEDPNINPEEISLKTFSDAQIKYAENIAQLLGRKDQPVLDVGCGMGGNAAMLLDQGYGVELLTPHKGQKKYLTNKFPDLAFHHCKYEHFSGQRKYGTVLNAESLQYIKLDEAFEKTNHILMPQGKWVISDYFRLHEAGKNKSGHLLQDFEDAAANNGWSITYRRDCTDHVLPTVKLAMLYVNRFIIPLVDFGFRKLDHKKSWLYYMVKQSQTSIFKKIDKEMAAIDPEKFVQEKKYMLYVLERSV